ncbi:MAG: xanthine phosphoribosyltransferase [Ruminiclostridium sp.]|nr:xanthine phosphoribosyltransferase [Ruminiclostridium sp.]
MEQLKKRILKEGKIRGTNEILKVDSFLNHQMDVAFLDELGAAFKARFADCQVDRILTIEASGIAIACSAAKAFGNPPVVFAKKNKTKNIAGDVYISQVESFTQGKRPYNIFVSKDFLHPGEKVLIIDDFLANGSALHALIEIVHQAGSEVAGAGVVVEKAFQPGGSLLRNEGVRVEALARIQSMSEETGVVFCD